MRNVRQRLPKGIPGGHRWCDPYLRQLRVRYPQAGTGLRALRLQGDRTRGRGGKHGILLRPLRARVGSEGNGGQRGPRQGVWCMNANWLFLLLRVIHVVAGVLWVGGVVFMTRFLLPSARPAGPAAGPMMQQLSARKLAAYTPIVAVLTVLAGIGLYWHDSAGFRSH